MSKHGEKKSRNQDGYSSLAIHEMMLRDRIRTGSYRKAIARHVKKNDVVLDLGCGTGILSFFAAQRACRKVYAVEKNPFLLETSKKAAQINKLDRKIKFVRSDIYRLHFEKKIDVLVQEQIGSFLWDEGLLHKVKFIRERFMKKNGRMIPYKIDLHVVPVNYKTKLENSLSFWSKKIYGLSFKNFMREAFLQNLPRVFHPHIIHLNSAKSFLADEKLAYSMDLRRDTNIPKKITALFKIRKKSKLTGFCAFFTVHLDSRHHFSTRPKKVNTHWGQIFIPLFNPLKLRRGSKVQFCLFPKRDRRKWKIIARLVE